MSHRGSRSTPLQAHTPDDLSLEVARGSEAAFEQLYRRFSAGLVRFFRKRTSGQAELAEDLAQQTWTQMWTALHKRRYDPQRAAFSTFLYTIGYRQWIQHLRGAKRSVSETVVQGMDQLVSEVLDRGGADEQAVEFAEKLDALRNCVEILDAAYSLEPSERAIVGGIMGGLTERQLAEQERIAPSTVNARKKAAYGKLRGCLAAKGFMEKSERQDA